MIAQQIALNWWALAVRGGVAILFGLGTVLWRDISLDAMLLLFGSYAVLDGVTDITGALKKDPGRQHWWLLGIQGTAGVVFGLLTWTMPGITPATLLYLIAGWALLTGFLELLEAVQLQHLISGDFAMWFCGLASVALGGLLIFHPAQSAVAMAAWIGTYGILIGSALLGLSFRLRKID